MRLQEKKEKKRNANRSMITFAAQSLQKKSGRDKVLPLDKGCIFGNFGLESYELMHIHEFHTLILLNHSTYILS
jgi:hypothetical protein